MTRPEFTPGPYYSFDSGIYADVPQPVDHSRFKGFGTRIFGVGFLIAESIPHKPTRDLLASAPQLYDFIASMENDDGRVPSWLWDRRLALLAKARGEL